MDNLTKQVELFHLLFLRQLESKLDKRLYVLKGGCNLRFYFKSIRYSEDIDIDVTTITKATLEKKISKILESADFLRILQSKNINIMQVNPVKQTDTTQRWKLLLRLQHITLPVPTKIEFSRRKLDEGISFQPVEQDIITAHGLYPILCSHYVCQTAFLQKVRALIHRTETQARDIFDLKWLLDLGANPALATFNQTEIDTSIQNLRTISYAEYKGQVVAYLLNEYKHFYDSEEQWLTICAQVEKALKGMNLCS